MSEKRQAEQQEERTAEQVRRAQVRVKRAEELLRDNEERAGAIQRLGDWLLGKK